MKKKAREQIALFSVIGLFSSFFFVLASAKHITLCPLYNLSGIPCPTCGASRAWISLLRGKISEAFRYHPLFWFIPLFFLFLFFYPKLNKKYPNLAKVLLILAIAIVILTWCIRMFLYFPNQDPMVWNTNAPVYRILSFIKDLSS